MSLDAEVRQRRTWISLGLCILLGGSLTPWLGCSNSSGPAAEHPSRELLVQPIPAADTLRFIPIRTTDATDSWPPFPARPPHGPTLVVGALNAPDEQVFGEIRGVVEDQDRRLLVLDAQARAVRVFDETGSMLRAVGRGGHGPGEFVHPQAMRIGPGERLYVADRLGRIGVFDIDPDSIRFDHSFRFAGDLWDACMLGDRLYIHGMKSTGGRPFHVHALRGDAIVSFGQLYPSRSRIIQYQLSYGHVACLDGAGVVLHAPELLPQVHAYDAAGDLVWWMDIAGFEPMSVWEMATGGSMLRRPDRTWHASIGLVPSPAGDAALLQVAEHAGSRSTRTGAAERVHTFIISATHHRARYVGDGWPRIVGWTEDRVFAVREDPHPQVLVFDLRVTDSGAEPPAPESR